MTHYRRSGAQAIFRSRYGTYLPTLLLSYLHSDHSSQLSHAVRDYYYNSAGTAVASGSDEQSGSYSEREENVYEKKKKTQKRLYLQYYYNMYGKKKRSPLNYTNLAMDERLKT